MLFDTPPVIVARSALLVLILYAFVDAWGSGFGDTMYWKGKIHDRIGTWSNSEDNNSSNWREFENLVREVEEAGEKGWLIGATLVLVTDNYVLESVLYKGNSTSLKLFKLVVRLRKVDIKYSCRIIATHMAGAHMIVQGTD